MLVKVHKPLKAYKKPIQSYCEEFIEINSNRTSMQSCCFYQQFSNVTSQWCSSAYYKLYYLLETLIVFVIV